MYIKLSFTFKIDGTSGIQKLQHPPACAFIQIISHQFIAPIELMYD